MFRDSKTMEDAMRTVLTLINNGDTSLKDHSLENYTDVEIGDILSTCVHMGYLNGVDITRNSKWHYLPTLISPRLTLMGMKFIEDKQ